jgi:hypothetical protein
MGNTRPKQAGMRLEVQVVFERHRISDQCLIAAWELILPRFRCQLPDKRQPVLPATERLTPAEGRQR